MSVESTVDGLRALIQTVPKWHNGLDHFGVKRLMELVDRIEKYTNSNPPKAALLAIENYEFRSKVAAARGKELKRKPNWAFAKVDDWLQDAAESRAA